MNDTKNMQKSENQMYLSVNIGWFEKSAIFANVCEFTKTCYPQN